MGALTHRVFWASMQLALSLCVLFALLPRSACEAGGPFVIALVWVVASILHVLVLAITSPIITAAADESAPYAVTTPFPWRFGERRAVYHIVGAICRCRRSSL